MSADRLECLVPGCQRSRARKDLPAHHTDWICSIHWRAVPPKLRRLKARYERFYRKFGCYPRERLYGVLWRRIVAIAIGAANG